MVARNWFSSPENNILETSSVAEWIKGPTQLHTRTACGQEGNPLYSELLVFLSNLTNKEVLITENENKANGLPFSGFSDNRPARIAFEDFAKSPDGSVSQWYTVRLTSKISERKLFFSLVKKLLITGLNINEVSCLEYLIELRYSKMLVEEQVLSTLLSSVALATVNGARNRTSIGKSILRFFKQALKEPAKLLEIRATRLLVLSLNSLLDLTKYEKSIKLTFDVRPTPPKRFPEKKHIGVSNSQAGSKKSVGNHIEPENWSDEVVLNDNFNNSASEMASVWENIKSSLR